MKKMRLHRDDTFFGELLSQQHGQFFLDKEITSNTEQISPSVLFPDEIWRYIFLNLPALDLLSVRLVCRFWPVAHRDEFLWKKVRSFYIELEEKDIEFSTGIATEVCIHDQDPSNRTYKILNEEGSCMAIGHHLPEEEICSLGYFVGSHLWQRAAEYDPAVEKWNVSIFMHLMTFAQLTQTSNLEIDAVQLKDIRLLLCRSIRKLDLDKGTVEAYQPPSPHDRASQPPGISVNLFSYQLDALGWMKYVEHHPLKIDYCPLLPWCSTVGEDILFSESGRGYHVADPRIENYKYEFEINGGVLADESGLGKRIDLLSLILTNPLSEEQVKRVQRIRDPFYLVKSKATLIICPFRLMKTWKEIL